MKRSYGGDVDSYKILKPPVSQEMRTNTLGFNVKSHCNSMVSLLAH